MTLGSLFSTGPRQMQQIAAVGYLLTILCLVSLAFWMSSGLYADYLTVGGLRDRLAQLDARRAPSMPGPTAEGTESGSPFIEGATITQAGATLQQRIERAVVRAGGSIIASQVQIEDQQAKTGAIALTAELELAQPAIQGFLYDLEAGMPYLFIDTLSVQSPQRASDQDGSMMNVSIGVSGQWQARP